MLTKQLIAQDGVSGVVEHAFIARRTTASAELLVVLL